MSNLKPTKPLTGFVELLPKEQRFVDEMVAKMQEKLRLAGFDAIDLPAIERAEVLTDETDWAETKSLMFLFEKGDTKMGLRYDGTVGLARYVAKNMNELTFPARFTQFSKRYRGERPQKGRYREFYQLDLDILGVGELSANYDAEIIKTVADMYDSVPEVVGNYVINIGSRTFWNEFTKHLNLSAEQIESAYYLIDRKAKISTEEFGSELVKSVGADNAAQVQDVFINGYENFAGKTPGLDIAIRDLSEVMTLLESMGVKSAKLNLSTMRGLGYYDGIVYEAESLDYPEIGSIGGGGRYGNLVGRFSKAKIIGSGYAIGTNRMLITALDRVDLSKYESRADVAVLCMGADVVGYAFAVTAALRNAGISTIPYLDADKKFKNQMEFADKIGCKFSVIIGEDEVKDKVITLKNMNTGEQQKLTLEEAIKVLKS